MKFTRTLMVAALLTAGAAAYAQDDTIDVTPGNYTLTKETSSNLQPEPVVKTEDKCITESEYNPVKAFSSGQNCSTSNVKKQGNTLTFDFVCKGGPEMPPLNGTAEYSSNGMAIAWTVVMKGQAEGKEFTINSKAEGKRTGNCK